MGNVVSIIPDDPVLELLRESIDLVKSSALLPEDAIVIFLGDKDLDNTVVNYQATDIEIDRVIFALEKMKFQVLSYEDSED